MLFVEKTLKVLFEAYILRLDADMSYFEYI